MFCGEKITDDFIEKQKKLPLSRRNVVCKVEKMDTDKSIVSAGKKRSDEWGEKVVDRVQQVRLNETDLVEVDAQYHLLCQQKFYTRPTTGAKWGYRPATNVDEAMEVIYTYLDNNSDECQFSLDHLIDQIEREYRPEMRTVMSRLKENYGEDIVIADSPNRGCIVCFRNTDDKILSNLWYQNRSANPQEERLRVVKAVSKIILEDIRSSIFSTAEYPPTDKFLGNVNSVIPELLLLLFCYFFIILANKRGSLDSWKKKCDALAHDIIAAVRPKSFLSSLLTGIGVFNYKKIVSKQLLDLLSMLGFSSTYYEAARLEASFILGAPENKITNGGWCIWSVHFR